jgi:hypothetical protein
MMSFGAEKWAEDLVVFFYFNLKGWILNRIFKFKDTKVYPVYALVISVVMILFNNFLWNQYRYLQNSTIVKGAINLPGFVWIFLLADLITTVVMYFKLGPYIGLVQSSWRRIGFDLMRLGLMMPIFFGLMQPLWMRQVNKQANWDYYCFGKQIEIDFAAYYLKFDKVPAKLADFTEYTLNPVNNSPLRFAAGDVMLSEVDDLAGNSIFMGGRSLIGIGTYKKMPQRFFEGYRPINNSVCKGKLVVPEW